MSDPVSRLNAALEGRYAIERELGEGGMATVYLADDLKHERKVARGSRTCTDSALGTSCVMAPGRGRFIPMVGRDRREFF